ncbi:MAG TPA: alkaline phosphatase PhoX [Candidatus Krumholzibacteria bacterium]|nr:alkaline phosphatase PhoX [Candidatus Krumholzibacteria bacterium]
MRAPSSSWTRRRFLGACGAVTVGFVAYRRAFERSIDALASTATTARGYGALVADPAAVIDLPQGFHYKVVARTGDEMADGLLVPGLPDAMAAFPGAEGRAIVVCNHECLIDQSAFGSKHERLKMIPAAKLYDNGGGVTPCAGGTTTFVWDTRAQSLVTQHVSLAGTLRNCAGGATPWGSWLSCEETVLKKGLGKEDNIQLTKDHGWVFEVPATAEPSIADPIPIVAMGRFMHEAVSVDPRTGIVYLTEDRDDGLIYRFLPAQRGDLHAGGRLQALALASGTKDSRNWPSDKPSLRIGDKHAVKWIDLDDIEAPDDDLRARGYAAGACRFARGEGMWMGEGEVYFVCTDGGRAQIGQVFRYTPSAHEGTAAEAKTPGQLELFIEPNDAERVKAPDNVVVAPWGDVLLCEDGADPNRIIGVTPAGALYTFARSRVPGEFAGATFARDGSTLFVNLQQAGLTLAITGPWRAS